MRCPFCKQDAVVATDTRTKPEGIWLVTRRRRCDNCSKKFLTIKVMEEEFNKLTTIEAAMRSMMVKRNDGGGA